VDDADRVPIGSLDIVLFIGTGGPTASWPTGILISRHVGRRIGFCPLQADVDRKSKGLDNRRDPPCRIHSH
jgi:hypothetical protein